MERTTLQKMLTAKEPPRLLAKIMRVRDLITNDMLVENLTERDSQNSIWIEKQSRWLEKLKPRVLVEIILKPLIKRIGRRDILTLLFCGSRRR
jgi:hypothetical protein